MQLKLTNWMKRCVESCLCCYTVRKVASAQKEKNSKSKVELKREQSVLYIYITIYTYHSTLFHCTLPTLYSLVLYAMVQLKRSQRQHQHLSHMILVPFRFHSHIHSVYRVYKWAAMTKWVFMLFLSIVCHVELYCLCCSRSVSTAACLGSVAVPCSLSIFAYVSLLFYWNLLCTHFYAALHAVSLSFMVSLPLPLSVLRCSHCDNVICSVLRLPHLNSNWNWNANGSWNWKGNWNDFVAMSPNQIVRVNIYISLTALAEE